VSSRSFHLDADNVLRCCSLADLTWLQHGFGTRLASNWPMSEGLTSVRQVHSNHVLATGHRTGVLGEADALISNKNGTFVSIRTADCLPILIADVETRAVAAVHAGWKGTVSGICVTTIRALEREYGSKPEDLRVAVGPGIGACCFEVGPEVAIQFRSVFPERDDLLHRTRLDLAEANVRQLEIAGISPERISVACVCTQCATGVYHSYRRDRESAGRQVSGIGIIPTLGGG
jgi:YfiH family protein